MNQKGFSITSIIIAIFLFIILSLGAYFFLNTANKNVERTLREAFETPLPSPLPDETADWSTYINQKYAFSIKYPKYLNIDETTVTEYGLVFSRISLMNYPLTEQWDKPDAIFITIKAAPLEKNIPDLRKWIEEKTTKRLVDGSVGPDARNFSTYKFYDIEGLSYETGQESIQKNVAFIQNNMLVIFALHPTSETGSIYNDNEDAPRVFDKILSTFKFTDQNVSKQQAIENAKNKMEELHGKNYTYNYVLTDENSTTYFISVYGVTEAGLMYYFLVDKSSGEVTIGKP